MKETIILLILFCCFNQVFGQWTNEKFTHKKYNVVYESIQDIDVELYQNKTIHFNKNSQANDNYVNSPEGVLTAFRHFEFHELDSFFYYPKDKESIQKKEEQNRTKINNKITYGRDNEHFYELMFKLNFSYLGIPTAMIKVTAMTEKGEQTNPTRRQIYCFQQINGQWYMVDFENFHEKNLWLIKALVHSRPKPFYTLIKGENPTENPLQAQMLHKVTNQNGIFDFNLYMEEVAITAKNKNRELYDYFFKPIHIRISKYTPSTEIFLKSFKYDFSQYPYKNLKVSDRMIPYSKM